MSNRNRIRPRDLDRLHETLRHRYRRAVLAILRDSESSVSVTTLAERLSDRLDDARDASVELHHVHLPKLAEADLVRYDRSERRVELPGDSLPDHVASTLRGSIGRR